MTSNGLTALLVARGLHRFYHVGDSETVALRDVGIELANGEFLAIVGPSGSGKSTLIACLTGLDEPDAGHVDVNGKRITRRPEPERAQLRARLFGILLQSGNLFPHLTVAENITLQLDLAGTREDRHAREALVLASVGISDRAGAFPSQLSGGEAARAGLAIALAVDPPILVADEPTAEVDRQTEELILTVFDKRKKRGRATIVATHSQALAERADRIVHLEDGRLANV